MTAPPRFTDPLDGASYSHKGQFRYTHASAILTGLRNLDGQCGSMGLWNWVEVGASGRYGIVEQKSHGDLIAFGATRYYTSPRAVASPYAALVDTAHPGAISMSSPARGAYSSSLTRSLAVYGGLSYRTGAADSVLGAGVALPGSITTAGDVLWCASAAQFVVVGTAGAGGGQIGVSAAGASWAASTGVPGTDAAWGGSGFLASNGALGILAVPSDVNNPSVWYSADGGSTFTKYATGITTTNDLRGPTWDSYRSTWLMVLRDNTIYSCANPTSGSWIITATLPTGFVTYDFVSLPGGQWVALGDDGLAISTDGGTTWEKLGGYAGTRLALVDGRVFICGGTSSWISGLY
jgi:hypothetical protein